MKNPIAAIIGAAFGGDKTANTVTALGDTVDRFIETKGEKADRDVEIQKILNAHDEAVAADATKNVELYLTDTANARDMNARIQESEKASWLSKNIAYIIDCVTIGGFILMLTIVIFYTVPEANKELFYSGFGVLGTLAITSVNFHRGTSKGSENKQKQIDKLGEKLSNK